MALRSTIVGALLSIPLAVNIEELVHYRTPGKYLAFDLFYGSQDLSNLGWGMLVRVSVDSILCFVAMCGSYGLYSKLRRR
jgi:hypothetical protein